MLPNAGSVEGPAHVTTRASERQASEGLGDADPLFLRGLLDRALLVVVHAHRRDVLSLACFAHVVSGTLFQ